MGRLFFAIHRGHEATQLMDPAQHDLGAGFVEAARAMVGSWGLV